MASISDVLPTALSPAINTFRRPRLFPSSVKGLRLGILMLGMTSCGAPPLPIMLCGVSSRSPSSITETPPPPPLYKLGVRLPRPSESEPLNEPRREETLLSAEEGPEGPGDRLEARADGRSGGVGGSDIVSLACLARESGTPLQLGGRAPAVFVLPVSRSWCDGDELMLSGAAGFFLQLLVALQPVSLERQNGTDEGCCGGPIADSSAKK